MMEEDDYILTRVENCATRVENCMNQIKAVSSALVSCIDQGTETGVKESERVFFGKMGYRSYTLGSRTE
jgi:hypothetical protein